MVKKSATADSHHAPLVWALAIGALSLVTACTTVPVYQRSRLAHPTMDPSHGTTLAHDHVNAVHEGATGGSLQTTSGCGCN